MNTERAADRALFHAERAKAKALGLSVPVAIGVAIDAVERSRGGGYEWRKSFTPTTNDERILRTIEGGA